MTVLEKGIKKIGINRLKNDLGKLQIQATKLVKNAGEKNGCALQQSGIPAESVKAKINSKVLVIDIGDTHTKVGFRSVNKNGKITWKKILDLDHEKLNFGKVSHSMERYTQNLMKKILENTSETNFDGISIVWSNGMTVKKTKDDITGVEGIISGRKISYNKGEFFITDLKDGDNIKSYILSSMKKSGLSTKTFIIGNDTVFTLKARKNSDAGVVCATGANGTLIKDGKIFGGELGATFIVPSDLLTDAENNFFKKNDKQPCLEYLCAGMGIAKLFEENIKQLGKEHDSSFRFLAEDIEKRPSFTPELITALAKRDFIKVKSKLRKKILLTDHNLEELSKLALAMEKRAGVCGGILAYMTIVRQVKDCEKTNFKIALDSTIARFSPVFLKKAQETLDLMLRKTNSTATLYSLVQEGDISVPMQGAASSLDNFL